MASAAWMARCVNGGEPWGARLGRANGSQTGLGGTSLRDANLRSNVLPGSHMRIVIGYKA